MVRNLFYRNGSGQEALPKVREWSGGPPSGSGEIRNGQEALPKGQEWPGGPIGGLGVVGSGWKALPKGRELSGVFGRPCQRAERVREALPEGPKWPEDWEWPGSPQGGSGIFWRPFQRIGSGWEWSGGPFKGPEVVGSPFQRARSSWEAHPEGQE